MTGRHDTLGDLRSLLGEGQSYRIRRDPVRKTWLVSLLDADDDVLDYGEADDIEAAAAQLIATLEAVALHERLVSDTEPILSAELDTRPTEAAE